MQVKEGSQRFSILNLTSAYMSLFKIKYTCMSEYETLCLHFESAEILLCSSVKTDHLWRLSVHQETEVLSP